jgi:hypothetical protein
VPVEAVLVEAVPVEAVLVEAVPVEAVLVEAVTSGISRPVRSLCLPHDRFRTVPPGMEQRVALLSRRRRR